MRQLYLSRQGKSYGPYTEDQMRKMAGDGQLVPHDLVALAGDSRWQKAADVPGLFAARPAPKIPPIPPVPTRPAATYRIACFGCFGEVTVTVPAGAHAAPCPKCGTALQVAEAPRQEGDSNGSAFAGVGGDINERIERTLAGDRLQGANAESALDAALLAARIAAAVLNAGS